MTSLAVSGTLANVIKYCVKRVWLVQSHIIQQQFDARSPIQNACSDFQVEWHSGSFTWPHQLMGFLFRVEIR